MTQQSDRRQRWPGFTGPPVLCGAPAPRHAQGPSGPYPEGCGGGDHAAERDRRLPLALRKLSVRAPYRAALPPTRAGHVFHEIPERVQL